MLMFVVVAICLGSCDSCLGSPVASGKPRASRPTASVLRDSVCRFVAAADSIVVWELETNGGLKMHRAAVEAMASLDSAEQDGCMVVFGVPDTVPLVGSWRNQEVPFGSFGYPPRSRGRRLGYLDRASLMELLGDRRAYQEPVPTRCIFQPNVGVRIYQGAEIGEFLMETKCLTWQFNAGGASGTGDLHPVLKQYRRFAMRAFRDNPVMLRVREAMH
jgi:hypothetical protein